MDENVFPAALVWQELEGVPSSILSQLQYLTSTTKKGESRSLSSLEELEDVPEINRSKRKAWAPRYATHMWNQYDSTIEGQAKTNNVSEGWNNRFHILMEQITPIFIHFWTKFRRNKVIQKLLWLHSPWDKKWRRRPGKSGWTCKSS